MDTIEDVLKVMWELDNSLLFISLISNAPIDAGINLAPHVGKDFAFLYREHIHLEKQYESLIKGLEENNPVSVHEAKKGGLWALNIKVKDSFVLLMRFIIRNPDLVQKLKAAVPLADPKLRVHQGWIKEKLALEAFSKNRQIRLQKAAEFVTSHSMSQIRKGKTWEEDVEILENECIDHVNKFLALKKLHAKLKRDRESAQEHQKAELMSLNEQKKSFMLDINDNRNSALDAAQDSQLARKRRVSIEKQKAFTQLADVMSKMEGTEKKLQEDEAALKKKIRLVETTTKETINEYDSKYGSYYKALKQQKAMLDQEQRELETLLDQLEEEQKDRKIDEAKVMRARAIKQLFQRSQERAAKFIQKYYRSFLAQTEHRRRLGLYDGWEAYKLAYPPPVEKKKRGR